MIDVIMHVDDVFIFAFSIEELDRIIREVCRRIINAGITLNEDTCIFGVKKIVFAVYIVSERCINVHPDCVSTISFFPTPKTVGSVRKFIGVVNFAGKFIPNKSELLEPLNSLRKNNVPFVWGDSQR